MATLPNEFHHFDTLINDKINDLVIKKQLRKNATIYTHVNIQHNNPSMSVIIQKKKTHTELIQYLHSANFSPVKSTFEKVIKKGH